MIYSTENGIDYDDSSASENIAESNIKIVKKFLEEYKKSTSDCNIGNFKILQEPSLFNTDSIMNPPSYISISLFFVTAATAVYKIRYRKEGRIAKTELSQKYGVSGSDSEHSSDDLEHVNDTNIKTDTISSSFLYRAFSGLTK